MPNGPVKFTRDERLSFNAIGVMAYLCNHSVDLPAGADDVSLQTIVAAGPDGPDVVLPALSELCRAGYLKRTGGEHWRLTSQMLLTVRNSYTVRAWAAGRYAGGPGAKFTLMLLAHYADQDFSCAPSADLIAEKTGQSVSMVRKQIQALEERGLIRVEDDVDEDGQPSSRYYLRVGQA